MLFVSEHTPSAKPHLLGSVNWLCRPCRSGAPPWPFVLSVSRGPLSRPASQPPYRNSLACAFVPVTGSPDASSYPSMPVGAPAGTHNPIAWQPLTAKERAGVFTDACVTTARQIVLTGGKKVETSSSGSDTLMRVTLAQPSRSSQHRRTVTGRRFASNSQQCCRNARLIRTTVFRSVGSPIPMPR